MALASGLDQLIHYGLVEHAAFAVEDHYLGLEAVRLHLGLEVIDDVVHHGADALRVLDQHGHLGGPFGQIVAVLFAKIAGDRLVGFVDGGLVDLELHLRGLEVQRQRGLVADGFLERVTAHVAFLVFVGAEGPVGIAVGTVDGRAGEAEEEGIGQGLAHLAAQIAFLRAVGFVHHHDDVGAFVQPAAGLAELVDGSDEDLAHVLPEQGLQFLPRGHAHHVRHVGGVEGGGDLRVEVDAVHHDHHRGIA